jgi:uncharacterized protein (TIGR02186 family)
MIARLFRCALALAALAVLTAARDPILVPEVSQHEVQVRQGFTGTQLLLFGAILEPDGRRAGRDYDIVVVLKGPTDPILLREKQKIFGIWINHASTSFRSAPSFFAVASSRPIGQIVDPRTAAIYELGLNYLQLSPSGSIEPDKQVHFTQGLVAMREREGLYKEDPKGVSINGEVLYQARIDLPSNVETGRYTAETFAIVRGRVVASGTADVEVRKQGFERLVADFALDNSFFYGLFAVALSLSMGWLAHRIFAFI